MRHNFLFSHINPKICLYVGTRAERKQEINSPRENEWKPPSANKAIEIDPSEADTVPELCVPIPKDWLKVN